MLYDSKFVDSLIQEVENDLTDRDIQVCEDERMSDEEISAYTAGLRYAVAVLDRKRVALRHRANTATSKAQAN